ncbi:hypothetical protein D3C73_1227930 [compost metagenome]
MLGDVTALARPGGCGFAEHLGVAKPRKALGIGPDAFALAQVGRLAHTVVQVHGVFAAAFGDFIQHAQQGRQPRTARHQHQRPGDVAQVKSAQRRLQGDLIADLAAFANVVAHHAVRQQANQELQLIAAGRAVGE